MSKDLSEVRACGHCNNISNMRIVGAVSETKEELHPEPVHSGEVYQILECPACKKKNITTYFWHEYMDEEHELDIQLLYPINKSTPLGLPPNIQNAFLAADKVKTIDVNAYVILLRRLLEMVCHDRNAQGDTLALMLGDLASKNEIPDKLVKVAKGLKNFGNMGAHAASGNLTEREIPIVGALCTAILEYIYSAPHLATIAENKLAAIKAKKQLKK